MAVIFVFTVVSQAARVNRYGRAAICHVVRTSPRIDAVSHFKITEEGGHRAHKSM